MIHPTSFQFALLASHLLESFHARAIGAVVARFLHTEEVTGSNPVSPTKENEYLSHRLRWLFWFTATFLVLAPYLKFAM